MCGIHFLKFHTNETLAVSHFTASDAVERVLDLRPNDKDGRALHRFAADSTLSITIFIFGRLQIPIISMTFIKAVLYIFLVVPALLRGVVGHVKVIERAPRPTQTSAPLNRVEKRQAAATPTTSYFTFNAPSIYQPPNSGDPSWLVVEVTDTDTFAETAGAMSAYCNVSIPGITFSNGPESWNIDWPKGSNIQACGALTFGIAISMEGANTVITLQHT